MNQAYSKNTVDVLGAEILAALIRLNKRGGQTFIGDLRNLTSATSNTAVASRLRWMHDLGIINKRRSGQALRIVVLRSPKVVTEYRYAREKKPIDREKKKEYDRRKSQAARGDPKTEEQWAEVMRKIEKLHGAHNQDPLHDGKSLFRGGRVRVRKLG